MLLHGVVFVASLCLGLNVLGSVASPDLFTAVVDMERAMRDEQSAAILLRQYVNSERQRLDTLDRSVQLLDSRPTLGLSNLLLAFLLC